jgi:hypothetical protein
MTRAVLEISSLDERLARYATSMQTHATNSRSAIGFHQHHATTLVRSLQSSGIPAWTASGD